LLNVVPSLFLCTIEFRSKFGVLFAQFTHFLSSFV
jgi:hypothetical protein